MSIRSFSLGAIMLVALVSNAQVITDTLTAYKYKADHQGQYIAVFDDSNVTYQLANEEDRRKFKQAIKNNDKVIIEYPAGASVISTLRVLPADKKTDFINRFDTLHLGDFSFKESKSFKWNEKKFIEELSESPLDPSEGLAASEIPIATLPAVLEAFNALACQHTGQCNKSNPCIPFDFKNNGCNARAHWMRKILEEQFSFQCEKIFSEGKLIAVNDGECGGKCVPWGWHVAVLVTIVDAEGKKSKVVIDPSLFNRPVTQDEWTQAQRMTCNNRTGVIDKVSITSSNIWTPNGSTDINYQKTRKLLLKFCRQCR